MDLSHIIESILFVKGEPITTSRLSNILKKKEEEIESALAELEGDLSFRGIRLIRKENEVMLGTSPESSEYIRLLAREEFSGVLSKATLETLAIIVYHGPIVKGEIDFIRGVNSSFILRNLMVRGLIERILNPQDKRTYIYKPSMQFMQHLGIGNLNDLPEYAEFRANIDEFLKENINGDKQQPTE